MNGCMNKYSVNALMLSNDSTNVPILCERQPAELCRFISSMWFNSAPNDNNGCYTFDVEIHIRNAKWNIECRCKVFFQSLTEQWTVNMNMKLFRIQWILYAHLIWCVWWWNSMGVCSHKTAYKRMSECTRYLAIRCESIKNSFALMNFVAFAETSTTVFSFIKAITSFGNFIYLEQIALSTLSAGHHLLNCSVCGK